MFRSIANGRTVWVKDLVVEKKQGNNGEYDSKSILFNFATNRNYQVNQKQPDGSVKKVYPTDFILCRANGAQAQAIADYCSAKDAEGKTISRHLSLIGHIETYKSKRDFECSIQVPINGQVYPVTFTDTREVDGHIFIVEEFEFLDSNPAKKNAPIVGGAVANVQVGAVAVNPIAGAMNPPVQAVAPVQAQPVVQTQPVAPVQAVAPAMPVGYTGTEAPF